MTFGLHTKPQSRDSIISRGGDLLVNYRRLLRLSGLLLWLFLLVATREFPNARDHFQHASAMTVWLVCWLLFGACFWITTGSIQLPLLSTYLLTGVETMVALYFAWLQPDSSITFLLIFVAWQIALLYPPKVAFVWIVLQSIAHILINEKLLGAHIMDVTQYVIYFSFKTFTSIIVVLAKQESEARRDQAVMNAQLQATRELLAENSRSLERLRISRDLHDALGHRLSALFLHLEIAKNAQSEAQSQLHIDKAQQVSKGLLTDVRDVVHTLRLSKNINLHGALQALAEDLPGLVVHLDAPGDLAVEDANAADILVRCVQEIITNTLKHSGATELWIDVERRSHEVQVFAHDNGNRSGTARSVGLGLLGMRERFAQCGGVVEVTMQDGLSFSISALLPLQVST